MFVAIWGSNKPAYLQEDLDRLQRKGLGIRHGSSSFLMDVNSSVEAKEILGSLFDIRRGDILLMAGYATFNDEDHLNPVARWLENLKDPNPKDL